MGNDVESSCRSFRVWMNTNVGFVWNIVLLMCHVKFRIVCIHLATLHNGKNGKLIRFQNLNNISQFPEKVEVGSCSRMCQEFLEENWPPIHWSKLGKGAIKKQKKKLTNVSFVCMYVGRKSKMFFLFFFSDSSNLSTISMVA